MIGSMSHGIPARWTQMIARVRGVSTARMVSAVMFWLFASTSANTGVAPAVTIESKPFWDAAAEGKFLIKGQDGVGNLNLGEPVVKLR